MTMTEEATVTVTAPVLDAAALSALVAAEPDEDRLRQIVTDGLVGLDDPRQRVTAAAAAAKTAQEQGDAARAVRNSAALQLAQTMKAVRVWKDTLGITRNLWNRIKNDPEAVVGSYAEPETTAREAAVECRRWDALRDAAIAVRDDTATGLMNGRYGQPARNAEVVHLTGLTSARVAQLRTS